MIRTGTGVVYATGWRMPTRVEACSCTECPVDGPRGCSSTQTIYDAWPGWFLFDWLPRRAVCGVFGHKTDRYTGPNKCRRCLSIKVSIPVAGTP